jgi:hypothetical protein
LPRVPPVFDLLETRRDARDTLALALALARAHFAMP